MTDAMTILLDAFGEDCEHEQEVGLCGPECIGEGASTCIGNRYLSTQKAEALVAVVAAAKEVEKSEGAKPMTSPGTGAWRRYQNLRTTLNQLGATDE